jgi:Dynamin central region
MKKQSYALLHGYYLTRFPKPDKKEMNMSLEEARKMEQDFFIGNNMWNKLDRNRLGSPKLAEALSRLLSQMIEELSEPFLLSSSMILTLIRLPTLREKVSTSMRSLQEELQRLPRSLEDNPQAELWTLCMAFTKAVEDFVIGQTQVAQTGKKSFLQHCQPLYHILQEAITRTRPNVKAHSGDMQVVGCEDGVDHEGTSSRLQTCLIF